MEDTVVPSTHVPTLLPVLLATGRHVPASLPHADSLSWVGFGGDGLICMTLGGLKPKFDGLNRKYLYPAFYQSGPQFFCPGLSGTGGSLLRSEGLKGVELKTAPFGDIMERIVSIKGGLRLCWATEC